MGNTNKARLLVEESVAFDKKAGNITHLSMSMGALGLVYQILGEWDKSEQYYKEALSISQRLKDFQSIALTYEVLGWFHRDKQEYGTARKFCEKAIEVYKKAGTKHRQMTAYPGLILTYIELGEIEKAKNLIDSLHKFALELKDKELIAVSDALRAIMFRAQKNGKNLLNISKRACRNSRL